MTMINIHIGLISDIFNLAIEEIKQTKIDVNSADNGVHIAPNSLQPGAYHRVIHTDIYLKIVANMGAAERFLLEQK
ncbi:hypothetical protein ACQKNB_16070 [Lysinibacillus xylanilyticus]|uniref:hypothetical protein n=1 Tax=Lysinibacillus xylanilyticus TaxID=582475 RepID=UPI003CFC83B9